MVLILRGGGQRKGSAQSTLVRRNQSIFRLGGLSRCDPEPFGLSLLRLSDLLRIDTTRYATAMIQLKVCENLPVRQLERWPRD